MTVTYTAEVASCRGFGCFLKLLARWKGSIYKLVWPDLAAFLFLYYSLNLTYRYVLDKDQQVIFESICEYCETYSNLIPLSFVLGFYISIIMTRWWDQYNNIPWPDAAAVYVSSQVHGQDERGRMMRRTIMRYVCVCITMVLANISPRVKKRFPTLDHFVEVGLLLENEKNIISVINDSFPGPPKHWMPIVWAASIVTRARKEGRIRDDFSVKSIIDELNRIRGQCGKLLGYDTVSVPLVYTQVVTLAVYSFLITTIMGRQWLNVSKDYDNPLRTHNNYIDMYFPIFTILQFFFYMGWLKVAETLINPFGDDDEDFEVNWMIDRNIQVSYLIVDGMHHEHPDLVRDQYWDDVFPTELPYTTAAEPFREKAPQPSTANIAVDACGADYVTPSSVKVENTNPNYALLQEDNQSENQSERNFVIGSLSSKFPRRERQKSISGESNSSVNLVGMGSIANSLHKFGSLKKIFTGSASSDNKLTSANDGVALKPMEGTDKPPVGSIKISDQVIEELDEQMTITASGRLEPRTNVQDIFSNKNVPSSLPIDVPNDPNASSYPRNRPNSAHSSGTYAEIFSRASTTPNEENFDLGAFDNELNLSSGGSSTVDSTSRRNSNAFKDTDSKVSDTFDSLKRSRQQEKMSVKLVRSISAAPSQAGELNEQEKTPTDVVTPGEPAKEPE